MGQEEIGAYTASKSFVFGGQKQKGGGLNKNWNLSGKWIKNFTLECSGFCQINGVHFLCVLRCDPQVWFSLYEFVKRIIDEQQLGINASSSGLQELVFLEMRFKDFID